MRNRTDCVLYCFLLSIFFVFLVSCASKTEQALIGKWQETDGKEAIEFLKDGSFRGTLLWDMTKQPLEVHGTYAIKGDIIDLEVEKPEDLKSMRWKVSFSGSRNELTFVFQQGGAIKLDGSTSKYRRTT